LFSIEVEKFLFWGGRKILGRKLSKINFGEVNFGEEII